MALYLGTTSREAVVGVLLHTKPATPCIAPNEPHICTIPSFPMVFIPYSMT